jgi:K+-transporting ATPase ATPase C chain
MRSQIRATLIVFLAMTLITGAVYPAVVTLIAKVCFPAQADGSVLLKDEKALGSELIAQGFTSPKYFWPRPSAAGYKGDGGSGSNQAPSNPDLAKAVKERITALHAADPSNTSNIPVDLVTASASGLDPHISIAAANYQVVRVARARGRSVEEIQKKVSHYTEDRTFGVLGEPRVNVTLLNLSLDGIIEDKADHPATGPVRLYRQRAFMPD